VELDAFINMAINLLLAAQPCLTVFLLTFLYDRPGLKRRGPVNVAGMIAFLFASYLWFNVALVFVVLIAMPMNVGLCIAAFKMLRPRNGEAIGQMCHRGDCLGRRGR
jgi:uncharacterized membrane protein YozB (DUF420 family)